MNIRPPTQRELESVAATRLAYREMWAKLKDVPPREFDGSRDDINALDFIDYEAGHHPEGLAGAALMWGEVLVSTGAVSWAIGDEQHFVLTGDPVYPRALIFPYARVAEINGSSLPQFGKYNWLLEEAVLHLCVQGFDEDVEMKLQALLRIEYDGFIEWSQRWIESVYPGRGGSRR